MTKEVGFAPLGPRARGRRPRRGSRPGPRTRRTADKGPPRPRLCPRRRPSARPARARSRCPRGPTHPQGGEVDVHQTFCRGVVRHFSCWLPPKQMLTINLSVALRSRPGPGRRRRCSRAAGPAGTVLAGPGAAAAGRPRSRPLAALGRRAARRAGGACAATALTPWRGPVGPPGVARRLRPRRPRPARLEDGPGARGRGAAES